MHDAVSGLPYPGRFYCMSGELEQHRCDERSVDFRSSPTSMKHLPNTAGLLGSR
jgi:hypothetical protein